MGALLGSEALSRVQLHAVLGQIGTSLSVDPPRADIADSSAPDDDVAPEPEPEPEPAMPDTRTAAYARLGDVAGTLRALDPHSPVPAILRQARRPYPPT